jgi:hypothetical protein
MTHYGLEARTIHVGSPNENGDVESSNGGLKRSVEQHLLLRGSRDFESIEAYEAFLFGIMDRRNAGRQQRLAEEIAMMKPLSVKPWPQMRELNVRVGNNGILRVGSNGYSVPSGLKGKRVTVRIYEWQIEVWYANRHIETLPRMPGANHYRINYRHVIDSLLRKPGGFRNYRHRERPFPAGCLPPGLGGAQPAFIAPPGRHHLPADLETSRRRVGNRRGPGSWPAVSRARSKSLG